jgi:prepilin-type N-terminal cleavage/methylation domain-containing protein
MTPWPSGRRQRTEVPLGRQLRPQRAESGFTLIETLVALLVLGIGVVALMGGLAVAVFGSSLNRNQAQVDAALVMATENVKALPYVPCSQWASYTAASPAGEPYSATPSSAPPVAPPNAEASSLYYGPNNQFKTWPTNPSPVPNNTGYFTITVKEWTGDVNGFQAGACPASDVMQQVTITAISLGTKAVQQVAVLKGNWK